MSPATVAEKGAEASAATAATVSGPRRKGCGINMATVATVAGDSGDSVPGDMATVATVCLRTLSHCRRPALRAKGTLQKFNAPGEQSQEIRTAHPIATRARARARAKRPAVFAKILQGRHR